MKRCFTLLIFVAFYFHSSYAQILCVQCFHQNDSIGKGINNLILNGGFENSNCISNSNNNSFCPSSTHYTCDIVNWLCTGGGVQTYCHVITINGGSNVVEGLMSAYFGNYYCNGCSSTIGDTFCMNKSNCSINGIPAGYPNHSHFPGYGDSTGINLQQTVGGLVPGNNYVLEFWAGGEENYLYEGMFAVDIGFGKLMLKSSATAPVSGIGTRFIIQFTASSSSHTIKFTSWGHICSKCTELVLDDVRLYTLAELPESVTHCITSTNELPVAISTVYPNPVTNLLTVTNQTNVPSDFILYDIASKQLLQRRFSSSLTLNIESLAKGIYLYKVQNKEGLLQAGKLVKE